MKQPQSVSRGMPSRGAQWAIAACVSFAASSAFGAGIKELSGSSCHAQPRYACPEAKDCPADARVFLGAATEKKSGRRFFLDFPCDLKSDEKVAFILNLHGAGSIGNWER